VGLTDQQARRAVRYFVNGVIIQRPADREVWLRLDYGRLWNTVRRSWRRQLEKCRKELECWPGTTGYGYGDPVEEEVNRLIKHGLVPPEPDS
jgi:hypothetical protein